MSGVSVIIPSYNRAILIDRALKSVFSQTLPADEVIVIDDGSSDDTVNIIKADYPDVRLILQENKGISAARNTGIKRQTRSSRKKKIKFIPRDTNKNGKFDTYVADRNGNGRIDTIVIDADEDGKADYTLIDSDENGRADIKVITKILKGRKTTIWLYDTDEDGKPDVVGFDRDKDGVIDQFRRFAKVS